MPSQPRRKPAKKTYKLLRSKVRKSKPNFENGTGHNSLNKSSFLLLRVVEIYVRFARLVNT